MIPDELFARWARGENPADVLTDPDLRQRASDTADMARDLWTLYGIARSVPGVRVLEIGCNDGTSTLAWLKAAVEVAGRVVSVDISEVPVAEALIDHYRLRPYWTFLRGSSHQVLKALRAEGAQFDVCFVDGDHTEASADEDVEDCRHLLAPGGVLLTHDNWYTASDVDWSRPIGQRATPGSSYTALKMLRGDEWTGVVLPHGSNLGIWRKRLEVTDEIDCAIATARAEGLVP